MAGSSTRSFQNIYVFCGSKPGKDGEFVEASLTLGKTLSERKLSLVYGGGSLGLMGCVSTAASSGGSRVLGIIPTAMAEQNIVGKTTGDELRVTSMYARIAHMLTKSDAFIALPGGLGTLEELFQIASWAQLSIHQKPIGLLNVNNFFDGLFTFLDKAVECEFMSQATRQILISAPTVDELLDKLQSFVPNPSAVTKVDWSEMSQKRPRPDVDLNLRL